MREIIFDIDGTLWDSRQVVADAWNQVVLARTGHHPGHTGESVGHLFGRTMTDIARRLFPDLPPEERDVLADACFRAENEALERTPGKFYPGVLETIPQLARGQPLYIASNCQAGYIELVLRHSGLRDCFSGWICFDDTGLSKGENLRLLIERHRMDRPIYVGDTQGDWEACQAAGIPMIFAAYGLGEVDAPLPTIHHFSELLTLPEAQ